MANMSYCRYRNTLSDLHDCLIALQDETPHDVAELEEDEKHARKQLIEMCVLIADEFGPGAADPDEE